MQLSLVANLMQLRDAYSTVQTSYTVVVELVSPRGISVIVGLLPQQEPENRYRSLDSYILYRITYVHYP